MKRGRKPDSLAAEWAREYGVSKHMIQQHGVWALEQMQPEARACFFSTLRWEREHRGWKSPRSVHIERVAIRPRPLAMPEAMHRFACCDMAWMGKGARQFVARREPKPAPLVRLEPPRKKKSVQVERTQARVERMMRLAEKARCA